MSYFQPLRQIVEWFCTSQGTAPGGSGQKQRKRKMKKLMFAAVAAAAGGLMAIESANVVG